MAMQNKPPASKALAACVQESRDFKGVTPGVVSVRAQAFRGNDQRTGGPAEGDPGEPPDLPEFFPAVGGVAEKVAQPTQDLRMSCPILHARNSRQC
jgi:hypothetical protein